MPKRGPDGKFLPADESEKDSTEGKAADVSAGEETQVAVIDPDERIADLEAQLADKDAQIDDLKPTRKVAPFLFNTRQDVIDFYGQTKLEELLLTRLAGENKQRVRKGFDRLTYSKKEKAEALDALIDELLADRKKSVPPVEGWLSRGLKMIKPDGSLIQIPYEVQVNNVAGSLADGYVRYERKGYKRTEPMLCPTMDCWEEAAEDRGEWAFKGYCSKDHFDRTERGEPVPT